MVMPYDGGQLGTCQRKWGWVPSEPFSIPCLVPPPGSQEPKVGQAPGASLSLCDSHHHISSLMASGEPDFFPLAWNSKLFVTWCPSEQHYFSESVPQNPGALLNGGDQIPPPGGEQAQNMCMFLNQQQQVWGRR